MTYSSLFLQLGPERLAPLPPGELRVHWILPGDAEAASKDPVYQASVKQAVGESMQAVAAALYQEAEEKGFGQHVLVSAGCRAALHGNDPLQKPPLTACMRRWLAS